MFEFGETVIATRGGAVTGEDAQGNPTYASSTVTFTDVGVAPTAPDETAAPFGQIANNGFNLYFPYGSDVRASDVFEIRGVPGWHVQGDASTVDWRSPLTGWEAGTVVSVRRVS
jgi:hypothetical protein